MIPLGYNPIMVQKSVVAAIQRAIRRGIASFGSQDRLAEETGLHRNTISRWVRGDLKEPELEKIIRLFEVTGSDLNELKEGWSDQPEPSTMQVELLEAIRGDLAAVLAEQRKISGAQVVVVNKQDSGVAFNLPTLGEVVSSFEQRALEIKMEQEGARKKS